METVVRNKTEEEGKVEEFERRFPMLTMMIWLGATISSAIQIGYWVREIGGWEENPLFWPWWFSFFANWLALAVFYDRLGWAR